VVADLDPAMYAALLEQVESRQWSPVEELLAECVELLHANLRATLAGNGVKQSDLPKPLRVPRSSDAPPKPADHDEILRFFGRG